jgi:hypothetical protein
MTSRTEIPARYPISLVLVMLLASLTPFAIAATTETQFTDGTTTFTNTFTQMGSANTAGVNMPIGAEVSAASFTISGKASTTSWANASSNSDFGGPSTVDGAMNVPYFAGDYRYGINIDNDEAFLRPMDTEATWSLTSSSDISSLGGAQHNTTGGAVGNADSDLIGATTATTETMSGSTWNYAGPMAKLGDSYYVVQWTTASLYTQPNVHRYNATTGTRIGTMTIQWNSCTTLALAYVSDMTGDGSNTIWTTTWNYNYLAKWTITPSSTGGTMACQQHWGGGTYRVGGVAFDPVDNEMYLLVNYYQGGSYTYYLWAVNRSAPYTQTSNWLLMSIPSGKGQPAGLDVSGDRVTVNVYCTYATTNVNCKAKNWHSIFLKTNVWPEHQGDILFPSHAHFGLESMDDGTFGWVCYRLANCPSGSSHKIYVTGRSVAYSVGAPTTSNSIVTSSAISSTAPTDEVTLSTAITWKPSGTSVEFEATNDGGLIWKRAQLGTKITFANAGSQLGWRAYLNSTNSSNTPIIDTVSLLYRGSYVSNGYMRLYSYFGGSVAPVAATVWWNASTAGGSSMVVKWVTGTTSCSSTTYTVNYPGHTISFPSSISYLTLCFYLYAGGSNAYSPVLTDFNVAIYSNAPKQVKLDIGGDGSNEWTHTNSLLGSTTASGNSLVTAFNLLIPAQGSGTIMIPIHISSDAAGTVTIDSFSITYTMQTVNLDISWDEGIVLHETIDTYEVVTRHVIGENAIEISQAQLTFIAQPSSGAPSLTWLNDGTLVDDDPDDWITPNAASTWANNSNGILEIHWAFSVTSEFPEQNNVGFRVSCTDDTGYSPMTLSTGPAGILVNQSYGLGWMKVRDNDGFVLSEDVQNYDWVAAGETLHFQGAVWYAGTEDAPLDSTFDVEVIKRTPEGDFSQAKDRSNAYGEFFISVPMDSIDRPDGVFYEVQIDNPRDPLKVLPINSSWQRIIRIDASPPELISALPADNAYEAGEWNKQIRIRILDPVGSPEELTLHYWVEADHDSNRNGYPDASEYMNQTMVNATLDDDKLFFATIDDTGNPNMARVSYYVTGTDPAGNALDRNDGPGFEYDLVTYRSRVDMDAVFTGLHWSGHDDGERAFAGTTQYLTLGLVDANGLIDFEDISLIFDFEGPDPERDQQKLSYSGQNNTFWTDDAYLVIDSACNDEDDSTCGASVSTNETGLPWIMVTFGFKFSWDWPDADLGDVALEYKQLGSPDITRRIFTQHTFRVENDLVLDAGTYVVNDVQVPRTGPVFDGSRVVPTDRLRWSGRIVYEGSDVPAPRNLGITIEVFDGVQYWSDGSLTEDGGFSIEVPLDAAPALASSETRTFLAGIRNIPGRGEDMTMNTVSTTLQVHVDHAPPRVLERLAPIDIIDIANQSTLTAVPVKFIGSEDADLSGSPQWVHWLMRDENQRQIASGSEELGMLQEGHAITWTGTVDLIGDGLNPPLQDYVVGFWIEGWDAAGNPLATEGNSKSDPVREPVALDDDNELQWVKFGALGAQLTIERISADKERVAEGASVEVIAWIANLGGDTSTTFEVAFYSGDSEEPFATQVLNGISDESIPISATWEAVEGVDRVRVVVDANNDITEVDETDNSASVGISVEYMWGMGWVENARQNMLAVIGIIIAMLVLPIVAFVSMKGALTGRSELFEDDLLFEDDEDYDDDYDDDDEDDDYNDE